MFLSIVSTGKPLSFPGSLDFRMWMHVLQHLFLETNQALVETCRVKTHKDHLTNSYFEPTCHHFMNTLRHAFSEVKAHKKSPIFKTYPPHDCMLHRWNLGGFTVFPRPWTRSQEQEDPIEPDTVLLGATDRCETDG